MTKRYKLLDSLAHIAARWVPPTEPNFRNMNDYDFITVLSWCENWEMKKVYYTAYKDAKIDFQDTYGEWMAHQTPLPVAVRYQLERGVKFHHDLGNLNTLRTYAYIYQVYPKVLLWCGMGLLLIYLLS